MGHPICDDCGDPWQPGHACEPGSVLAEERFHAGVGIRELARATGLNIPRVEAAPFPSADARKRYRAGVAALRRTS